MSSIDPRRAYRALRSIQTGVNLDVPRGGGEVRTAPSRYHMARTRRGT